MPNPNPSPETRWKPGESGHVTHGGASAVKSMLEGTAFQGMAVEIERGVAADLEAQGRLAMVRETAVRAHTCQRMYWSAVVGAADKGDLDKLHLYVQRFGYLCGVTRRAWDALRMEEQISGIDGALDYDALLAQKNE